VISILCDALSFSLTVSYNLTKVIGYVEEQLVTFITAGGYCSGMSRTRMVIYCRKCGEKSLWYNHSRGRWECLNPSCAWQATPQEAASTPYSQEGSRSGDKIQSEPPRKRTTIQCKKCGKKSLWFNPSVGKYQCLNHKCRWECTPEEFANTPDFGKDKSKPPVFQEFGIPVWVVRTLESRTFWTSVGIISIVLWLALWLYFRYDDILTTTIAICMPISFLVAMKFLLRRFVRQYAVIAASLRHYKTKAGTSNWRRRIVGSSWLRLIVIIAIIAGLVIVPWVGYRLFTHQTDPVIGTITFLFAFGLFVWLIRLLNSSRQMSRKPGFKLVFFSLLGIALVCAFAGIEPLTTYKNISFDFIKQQSSKIVESFEKVTPPVAIEPSSGDVAAIIAKVKPSVVYIHTDVGGGSYIGSGMVIDKSGYILTNSHVIQGSQLPTVTLPTGMQYSCSIIKRDDIRDLAIIKIAASGMDLSAVTFGNSSEVESGDEVIAIGYSLGLEGGATVTKGIVSAFRVSEGVHYIQTDAAVNPGNSGAPLINMRGEVVGVITFKLVREAVEGMGFAVAISDARLFISEYASGVQVPRQEAETQTREQTLLTLEKETLMLINGERQARGMLPVVWNEAIHSGARRHSENMQEKGYLYHDTYGQFAECCYGGSYSSLLYSSAKATVDAWISSTAGHREILLDRRYTQGAVGIARDKGFWATYRCE